VIVRPLPHRRTQPREAFTLVELLVVMAVIASLAAIAFPVYTMQRERSEVEQTRSLIGALATAVAQDGRTGITCADGSIRRPFDLDRDRMIDGDPGHPEAPTALAAVAPEGYRGLVADTGTNLRQSQINAWLQPVDAWGRAVRIAWVPGGFGAGDYGLWSAGPDGIDAPQDPGSDDIRSWEDRR